jgi:hypothetical protein
MSAASLTNVFLKTSACLFKNSSAEVFGGLRIACSRSGQTKAKKPQNPKALKERSVQIKKRRKKIQLQNI